MDVCFIIFYPYGVIIIIAPSFLISSRELWHIPICGNLQQPSQDVSVHKFFDDPMLLELAKQAGQPQVIHPKLWYGPFTNREHDELMASSQDAELSSYFWERHGGRNINVDDAAQKPTMFNAHYSEPWHVIRCCNVLWSYLDCCFFPGKQQVVSKCQQFQSWHCESETNSSLLSPQLNPIVERFGSHGCGRGDEWSKKLEMGRACQGHDAPYLDLCKWPQNLNWYYKVFCHSLPLWF